SLVSFCASAALYIYTLSLHDALPISPGWRHYGSARRIARTRHSSAHHRSEPHLRRVRGAARGRRGARTGAHQPPPLALHGDVLRSEEHTSELQSRENLVCRLLLEKKK